MRLRMIFATSVVLLSACSRPGGPYPSLQPRAAEQIDPRLPVERPINTRPVNAALADRLAALTAQARSGDSAFEAAAVRAEQLAASAGPAQSESWVVAQEAVSAAIGARAPTTAALGAIDALGGNAIEVQGGLAPADLAAIRAAAEEVGALDRRQAARIEQLQRQLTL